MEMKSCRSTSVVKNTRCRCGGSWVIACWLASIVIGRSQKESVNRGAEVKSI